MHSLENQLWNLKLEISLICKCDMAIYSNQDLQRRVIEIHFNHTYLSAVS